MAAADAGQWRPSVSVCGSGAGCKTFLGAGLKDLKVCFHLKRHFGVRES